MWDGAELPRRQSGVRGTTRRVPAERRAKAPRAKWAEAQHAILFTQRTYKLRLCVQRGVASAVCEQSCNDQEASRLGAHDNAPAGAAVET